MVGKLVTILLWYYLLSGSKIILKKRTSDEYRPMDTWIGTSLFVFIHGTLYKSELAKSFCSRVTSSCLSVICWFSRFMTLTRSLLNVRQTVLSSTAHVWYDNAQRAREDRPRKVWRWTAHHSELILYASEPSILGLGDEVPRSWSLFVNWCISFNVIVSKIVLFYGGGAHGRLPRARRPKYAIPLVWNGK